MATFRGELPRGRRAGEGPLDQEERPPRPPRREPGRWDGGLPARGLVCNVCGDAARDRRSAERHRERTHPEAAGSVHHRG